MFEPEVSSKRKQNHLGVSSPLKKIQTIKVLLSHFSGPKSCLAPLWDSTESKSRILLTVQAYPLHFCPNEVSLRHKRQKNRVDSFIDHSMSLGGT